MLAATGVTRYDEVVAPDGGLRPAWRSLASAALGLTPEDLGRVDGEITRFLADDGVTYGTPDAGAQPWQLDPVPLVIEAAAWSRLEVGLAQRAELLNALLADLYGPQKMLSSGVVPSAAIFAHAGFTRTSARASAFDSQPLLFSAADLGRDADGEWRVLADRVQAPSGLGFAMENRRVISQVLPELYHQVDLHRLEPYFAALRAALIGTEDDEKSAPRVVVLSPGPHSETAYDQAYLANALGFPLVQGSDLVVRDGWVWMKPAGWPRSSAIPRERIDVIVRRVDAEYCDPLELRADSQLGVAGLAEAVRRGRVRVINGLGAGVLENPALMPYLPAVSERLLGEQLRLPSVPTWWCGDPEAREDVLARLLEGDPHLIVRPIDAPHRSVADLAPHELAARVMAAPHRFVGQEIMPLSQAPAWGRSGTAGARPVALRTFTLHYRSAYRPLMGGLATVRESPLTAPTTKDVWVLKATASDPDQGLTEITPLPFSRSIPELSPRAMEDMFWAGRYAERAEDILRILLTAHQQRDQLGAHPDAPASAGAEALETALRRLAESRSSDGESEFHSLMLDTYRAGSAAHAISRLREALESVRDQLSGDTWRVFSSIERASKALRSSPHAHRTAESGGRMLTGLLSLQGVTASMMRDSGWHMIEAGRALERSLQMCHLLASTVIERRTYRADREVLEALLTAAESVVTHRRRYRGAVRPADALELLLLDIDNPRSLAFSLAALREHLAALPGSTGSTRPERLLEDLETTLGDIDIVGLTTTTGLATIAGAGRTELEAFLGEVAAQLELLADAIDQQHFESGPPPLAMSALTLTEERGEARV